MKNEKMVVKGNKDGINITVKAEDFHDFDNFTNYLIEFLLKNRGFYKNSILKISTDYKNLSNEQINNFKDKVISSIEIKDCLLDELKNNTCNDKALEEVKEEKTKFIRNTIRAGQFIKFTGNIVIIGDINIGAEVCATGNIIVLGSIKGRVRAGINGDTNSIVAGFNLQPQILQIANLITLSPEDSQPAYPEIAKIVGKEIIVEPYLKNKYIY